MDYVFADIVFHLKDYACFFMPSLADIVTYHGLKANGDPTCGLFHFLQTYNGLPLFDFIVFRLEYISVLLYLLS